jgi:hypothetical protein
MHCASCADIKTTRTCTLRGASSSVGTKVRGSCVQNTEHCQWPMGAALPSCAMRRKAGKYKKLLVLNGATTAPIMSKVAVMVTQACALSKMLARQCGLACVIILQGRVAMRVVQCCACAVMAIAPALCCRKCAVAGCALFCDANCLPASCALLRCDHAYVSACRWLATVRPAQGIRECFGSASQYRSGLRLGDWRPQGALASRRPASRYSEPRAAGASTQPPAAHSHLEPP